MDVDKKIEMLNKYRSKQELNFGVEFKKNKDEIFAEFTVKEDMLQPFGMLHGGVTASIGEGVASIMANIIVAPQSYAVGQSLNVNHVRSASLGDLVTVELEAVHQGRSSHVWRVNFLKGQQLLSSLTMTMAILLKKK